MTLTGYVFYPWTPERKAKFTEFRLAGMHTDWAIFWACVDRRSSVQKPYSEAAVYEYCRVCSEFHMDNRWSRPISSHTRPPEHLYAELQESVHEDENQ